MRLQDPIWLWTLAVLPLMVFIGWRWFVSIARLRRSVSIAVRSLLAAIVALTLSGAASVQKSELLAVVGVIDVSGSVTRLGGSGVLGESSDWFERVRGFVSEVAQQRGADDLLGLVVFDGRAVAIATPSRGDVESRGLDVSGAEGTSLGDAIELAAAMIPPEASGRLVIVSDGNETSGDAEKSVARIRDSLGGGASLPIDVVPVSYRVSSETLIESVDSPPQASGDAPVTVRVVISTTDGASGSLSLFREGGAIDLNGDDPGLSQRLDLPPGRHAVLLEVPLDRSRLHRFEAVFTPDELQGSFVGDTFAQNNRGRSFTVTDGAGSVLLLDGVGGGSPTGAGSLLATALRDQGIDVTLSSPESVPTDLLGFQPYDAIILQNVPADQIPEAAQSAMAAHVRELGAGLVMVGGRASFGAGGWKGTPIEDLLPVRMDLPERLVVAETAIVLVLDASGSMSAPVAGSTRTQQAVANSAAAAAVKSLDSGDLVGVVQFSSSATWVQPLGKNDRAERTADRIGSIASGGGTNLVPAVELAASSLRDVDAKVRHIIVLTDGRSTNSNQLPGIAENLAADGINVSTIAVGDGADRGTLDKMAELGGGVFYDVTNPSVLPRVFLRAVRVVRAPLIRERTFDPVLARDAGVLVGGVGTVPPLDGITLTQHLENAPGVVRVLDAPEGEPVLAYWPVELGRVAAFTSDTWDWATPWLDWPGYAEVWGRLLRTVSRPPADDSIRMRTTVNERGEVTVRLNASGASGEPIDLLDVPVTLYAPDGSTTSLSLEQVGPGEYRASSPATQSGTYVAVARPSRGDLRLPPAIAGASAPVGAEYRELRSNTALLTRLAEQTGGRVLSMDLAGTNAFDRTDLVPRLAERPLWGLLVTLCVIAFVLDVAARRIAWDRALRGIGSQIEAVESAVFTGSLRDRVRKPASEMGQVQGLDESDAKRLATEARAQRRAKRLEKVRRAAAQKPQAQSPASTTEPESQSKSAAPVVEDRTSQPQEGGLLAAKRRANQRFEDSE